MDSRRMNGKNGKNRNKKNKNKGRKTPGQGKQPPSKKPEEVASASLEPAISDDEEFVHCHDHNICIQSRLNPVEPEIPTWQWEIDQLPPFNIRRAHEEPTKHLSIEEYMMMVITQDINIEEEEDSPDDSDGNVSL